MGIRDGDPEALQALVELRGGAVVAYCERACPPGLAGDAAAEAFARFRALVVAADRPTELDPELALLSATRNAAARRAPTPQAPPAGALGRLLGGRPTVDQVAMVPLLLAARADGALAPADEERLNRLLDASASARAVEERFRGAELAYRSAGHRPVPAPVAEQIVVAMLAVPAAVDDVEQVAPRAAAVAAGMPAQQYDDAPPQPAAYAAPPAPPAAVPPQEAAPPPGPVPPQEAAPPPVPVPHGAVRADDFVPPEQAEEDVPVEEPAPAAAEEPAGTGAPPANHGDVDASPEAPSSADETAADAALTGDDLGETVEWHLPPEEAGADRTLDVEVAAARIAPDEAEHIQTASGAVEEPIDDEPDPAQDVRSVGGGPPPRRGQTADAPRIVAEVAANLPAAAAAAAAKARRAATTAAGPAGRRAGADAAPAPNENVTMGRSLPRLPADRPAIPGRSALAPAAAVVAVAVIGAMGTAGVFGGNDPSPPVDTGIVPPRALVAVPEGEAAAIVDDLRDAATQARRQRLSEAQARALTAAEAARARNASEATAEDEEGDAAAEPEAEAAPETDSPADTPQDEGTNPGVQAPVTPGDATGEGDTGGSGATTTP